MTECLGLKLDLALERYRARGLDAPEISETRSPRNPAPNGTMRVVRQSADGTRLVVARFSDTLVQEGGERE